MNPRRPTPATSSDPLPSMSEVSAASASPVTPLAVGVGAALAATAFVAAQQPVVCGQTRADELRLHGALAKQAMGRADVTRAVHEVLVATGLIGHRSTGAVDAIPTAGAVAPVTPTPPPVPQVEPDRIPAPGEAPMVQPTPPPPPVAPEGGAREVDPTPPTPPPPQVRPTPHNLPRPGGLRRVEPVRPEPPVAVPGGLGAVQPTPAPTGPMLAARGTRRPG